MVQRIRARPAVAIRLGRVNAVAGVSFALGGALFAVGALLAQLSSAPRRSLDVIFLCGGVFFSLGGYASIVQEVNAPRSIGADGQLVKTRWRWWAYEPQRPGWVSAFVLFVGTLAFAVSLLAAFLTTLDAAQADHLIWAPDMIGCVLFLVSGHVAIEEVCHGRFRLLPRSLGWWLVTVEPTGIGPVLRGRAGAYIRPSNTAAEHLGSGELGNRAGSAVLQRGRRRPAVRTAGHRALTSRSRLGRASVG